MLPPCTGLFQIKNLIIVSKSRVPTLEFQKMKLEANSSQLWFPVKRLPQHRKDNGQGSKPLPSECQPEGTTEVTIAALLGQSQLLGKCKSRLKTTIKLQRSKSRIL